jgi:hypothetical protein
VKIDTPEVQRISNPALRSGPFALGLRSWSNRIKAGHSPARKPSRPTRAREFRPVFRARTAFTLW